MLHQLQPACRLLLGFCLIAPVSSAIFSNSTYNISTNISGITSTARYTPLLLKSLWSGITVETAAVTSVVNPAPIPNSELEPPPNLRVSSNSYLGKLPKGFIWGWAATAGQIEGAVDADGRGPSIWDNAAHKTPNFIDGNSTLDITTNHYYLYKQDTMRMKALNVSHYSLTISWSRVFPFGNGTVNHVGLQHYIDEVDFLLSHNITPIVTLYHWDLPQALQNWYGGWLSKNVINDFGNYAKVLFEALAPKVNLWITLNEPQVFCNDYKDWPEENNDTNDDDNDSYNHVSVPDNVFPTHGMKDKWNRYYTCGHHAILAHAKAVQIFRETFQPQFGGKISFANSWDYTPPLTNSRSDREASYRALQFNSGWINHPIYINGDYPDIMREILGDDILPKFTEEQSKMIHNSTDFYAWDAYTGYPVSAVPKPQKCLTNRSDDAWPSCYEPVMELPGSEWLVGNEAHVSWLHDTPDMFRRGVNWSWEAYKPREYLIPEFGFATREESEMTLSRARYDTERVEYYRGYLEQVLRLVNYDRVNLIGVIGWSAMDNLEWRDGFDVRFGMQSVDRETQVRRFKKSAFYFSKFFEKHIRK